MRFLAALSVALALVASPALAQLGSGGGQPIGAIGPTPGCAIVGCTFVLPAGGSISITEPSLSSNVILKFPDATDGGAFSQKELLFKNDVGGQNVITLYNPNTAGFSAVAFRYDGNLEKMAVGIANSGTGYCIGPLVCGYIEAGSAASSDASSFTASISNGSGGAGTTLIVTGSPTKVISVGQVVAGSGVTVNTVITALGTGTGGAGTYTVNNAQNVGSEAMTSGWPPVDFQFHRTGYVNGNYQSNIALRVFNVVTGVDGLWSWTNLNGTTNAVMNVDPTNDRVDVFNFLAIGGGNNNLPFLGALTVNGTAVVSNFSDSTFYVVPVGSGQIRLKTDGAGKWISVADGAGTTDTASFRNGNLNILGTSQILVAAMTQTAVAQSGTVCYNSGTGAITYDATLGCLASTLTVKSNWREIAPSAALDMVLKMRPGSFEYKPDLGLPGGEQIGFVAEQLVQVDERLVGYDPDGKLRGVRYQQDSALYAGAIQALEMRVQVLEAQK